MAAHDPLEEYKRKRNFERSPEPRGKMPQQQRAAQGIFTVQKHAARRLHYDFRLELNGVLLSWAVTRGPSNDPSQKRLAVRTEDHPLSYARFEGDIPKGQYGGGHVMLWDYGTWEPLGDPARGLRQGKLHFYLHGSRMQGGWVLVKMREKPPAKRENWLLIKEDDTYASADPEALTEGFTTSIKTSKPKAAKTPGSSNSESKRVDSGIPAALPRFRQPQLATLASSAPTGDDWLHETKYDGYRLLAAVAGKRCRLYSRSGLDWTTKCAALVPALLQLPCDSALLDGEVLAAANPPGSTFSALQQALADRAALRYWIFDLLALDGEDLTRRPLLERKAVLEQLLDAARNQGVLHYSEHICGKGELVYQGMCEAGGEGIVSKLAQGSYHHRRDRSWLKVKCMHRQEFVVGGWSPSRVKGRPFASLLAGSYHKGQLLYHGRIGAGFDQQTMAMLTRKMAPLARVQSPFAKVPASIASQSRWLAPRLVMEVEFAEFTDQDQIRHGVFVGLRHDKPATEVHLEQPDMPISPPAAKRAKSSSKPSAQARLAAAATSTTVRGVTISHADRELFPKAGFTKGDLAGYYLACGKRMAHILAGHPLSLVRCPDGIDGDCFFQKHLAPGFPALLRPVTITEANGVKKRYFYVSSSKGLLAATQFNAIEFHGWGSRRDKLERPARLVLDLDPGPQVTFTEVKRAAQALHALLGQIGLASVPLLTGGKGIHVCVILHRSITWDTLKGFAKLLATLMAQRDPERFTAVATKSRRTGKIYVDWLRNARGATAIMPWSVRARPGAPVAVPVTWDELDHVRAANAFTLNNVASRLAFPCPYTAALKQQQRITYATVERLEALLAHHP